MPAGSRNTYNRNMNVEYCILLRFSKPADLTTNVVKMPVELHIHEVGMYEIRTCDTFLDAENGMDLSYLSLLSPKITIRTRRSKHPNWLPGTEGEGAQRTRQIA